MDKDQRLKEIEFRINKLNHILEGLTPIWSQVDKRIKGIKRDIEFLEDEKEAISGGQMYFDDASF